MWPTVQKKKRDDTHRDTKHKLLPERISSSLVFKGNSLTEALLLTEKLLTGCVKVLRWEQFVLTSVMLLKYVLSLCRSAAIPMKT